MYKIKKEITRLFNNARIKWEHGLLGLATLIFGIILIRNRMYFRHPPEWQMFMNHYSIGLIGIAIGIAILAWTLQGSWNGSLNGLILVFAIAFWTCLTTLEGIQLYLTQHEYYLMNCIFCLIALIVAFVLMYGTNTKSKAYKYIGMKK